MRTTRAIRRDPEAVSPVIATILMVAITVVLAAVLYVMVSGLVTGPGGTPQTIITQVSRTGDGLNWVVSFQSVPSGMANASVSLVVFASDGTVSFALASLDGLLTTTNGVRYVPIGSGSTLTAGDRVHLATGTYLAGSTFQLHGPEGLLGSGKLQ